MSVLFVFLNIAFGVTTPEKEHVYTFKENEIVISSTLKESPAQTYIESIFHTLHALYVSFEEKYGIVLPKKLHVVIAEMTSGAAMSTDPKTNVIHIYEAMGRKMLDPYDVANLAHELGHLAIGRFEDSTQDESFADFLSLNVVEWSYEKQGQKFPKGFYWFSQQRKLPFYKFLDQVQAKYGPQLIAKLIRDCHEEFWKTNRVSKDFLRTWVAANVTDPSLLETFRLASFGILEQLGVWVYPSSNPPGVAVEVFPYSSVSNSFDFRNGDVISKVVHTPVRSADEFQNALLKHLDTSKIWDSISIEVLRSNNPVKLKAPMSALFHLYGDKLIKKDYYEWTKVQTERFAAHYKNASAQDIKEMFSFYDFVLRQVTQKYGLKENPYHMYFFVERGPVQFPMVYDFLPPSITQPCQSVYIVFPKIFPLSLKRILEAKDRQALLGYLHIVYSLSPLEVLGSGGYLTQALYSLFMTDSIIPLILEYFQDLSPKAREALDEFKRSFTESFTRSWLPDEQKKFMDIFNYVVSLQKTLGTRKFGEILQKAQGWVYPDCKDTNGFIMVTPFKDAIKSLGEKAEILENVD